MFKKMIGYVSDISLLGEVIHIDLREEEVVIEDNNEDTHTVDFDDVKLMREVFVLNGEIIYEGDVLGSMDGDMFLLTLHDDGRISLDYLNDKTLEVVHKGTKFGTDNKTIMSNIDSEFSLQGNIYELRDALPKEPTFNVQIVKDYNGSHYTYFYACNDKSKKEIDLIKVIFIGGAIIDGEEYERRVLSYDEFKDGIRSGIYKEVSEPEFQNYVLGVLYNSKKKSDDDYCDVNADSCGCDGNCEFCREEEFKVTINFDGITVENDGVSLEGADADKPEACEGADAPVEPEKCNTCGYYKDECDCDLWE